MPKVSIENLKVGMKLSKPVLNDNGMILIVEGTEVTTVLIERLSNMNVAAVSVEGAPQNAKTKEELLAELDARFGKTGGEPYMGLIKKLFRERIEALDG
ncbi:MAG TPA: hypothetical protein VF790_00090 [Dissulfurispiraceae bacterium]